MSDGLHFKSASAASIPSTNSSQTHALYSCSCSLPSRFSFRRSVRCSKPGPKASIPSSPILFSATSERRREAQGKQPGTSSISGNAPNVNDNNARTIQKCKIKCKISSNRKQHNQSARHQSTWNLPQRSRVCRRVRRGRHADNATQPR